MSTVKKTLKAEKQTNAKNESPFKQVTIKAYFSIAEMWLGWGWGAARLLRQNSVKVPTYENLIPLNMKLTFTKTANCN